MRTQGASLDIQLSFILYFGSKGAQSLKRVRRENIQYEWPRSPRFLSEEREKLCVEELRRRAPLWLNNGAAPPEDFKYGEQVVPLRWDRPLVFLRHRDAFTVFIENYLAPEDVLPNHAG